MSVPFVFTILTSSDPAVPLAATLKYASPPALPSVKSFSSATFAVIPPAVEVSSIALLSVPFVLVITIVSLLPWFAVRDIADATSSFETRATWPPAMFTSFAAAASTSTPPAVAFKIIASVPVPWETIFILASFEPVKEIVRSSATASVSLYNPCA